MIESFAAATSLPLGSDGINVISDTSEYAGTRHTRTIVGLALAPLRFLPKEVASYSLSSPVQRFSLLVSRVGSSEVWWAQAMIGLPPVFRRHLDMLDGTTLSQVMLQELQSSCSPDCGVSTLQVGGYPEAPPSSGISISGLTGSMGNLPEGPLPLILGRMDSIQTATVSLSDVSESVAVHDALAGRDGHWTHELLPEDGSGIRR
jgi:hypothetical protein